MSFTNMISINSYDDFIYLINNPKTLFPSMGSKINEDDDKTTEKGILWYRGQASYTWNLIPNLYRIIDKDNFWQEVQKAEKSRLEWFQLSNYDRFPYSKPENKYLWMTIMQHYRSKTRLLDWSASAETAFFFAIHSYFDEEPKHDNLPCVWVLRPYKVKNQKKLGNLFTCKDNYYDFSAPLPVLAPYNNERIKSQEGSFVIFPNHYSKYDEFSQTHYFESLPDANNFLCQLVILKPEESRRTIKRIGSHISKYYPEITEVSQEIEEIIEMEKIQ